MTEIRRNVTTTDTVQAALDTRDVTDPPTDDLPARIERVLGWYGMDGFTHNPNSWVTVGLLVQAVAVKSPPHQYYDLNTTLNVLDGAVNTIFAEMEDGRRPEYQLPRDLCAALVEMHDAD